VEVQLIPRLTGRAHDPWSRLVQRKGCVTIELPGWAPTTASALARDALPVTRQGMLKHLGVLRYSELSASVRAGREVRFQVRPQALVATASWMTSPAATWDERLAQLKRQATQPSPGVLSDVDMRRGRLDPRGGTLYPRMCIARCG
jgi:hypothetical protein